MYRNILLFCSFLLSVNLSAQSAETITFRCELSQCAADAQVNLLLFNGSTFVPMYQAKANAEGVFEFEVPADGNRFYYVGTSTKNMQPIILGTEREPVLRGACDAIRNARFENSPLNEGYTWLKSRMKQLEQKSNAQARQYQRMSAEQRPGLVEQMKATDDKKTALLDSLRETSPYLAKIAAVNTYLSFQNNAGTYTNELDYFGREYFRFADLTDPDYNRMPWLYESFRSFTGTIISQRIPVAQQQSYLQGALAKIEPGSDAHKLALSGTIATLNQKQHALFKPMAQAFIATYREKEPQIAAAMIAEVQKSEAFLPGGEAPDFTQKTPDGEDMNLSDLRGKVVLVDFWASWCGPCRRENPNVVRLYNEYKEDGFDILGVSLDRNKDKWLAAIEKDGLTWHHVSDLRGWQNAAAQAYGVRSIPHTVLLDAEGKIIARNLRGSALEAKLAELFEE